MSRRRRPPRTRSRGRLARLVALLLGAAVAAGLIVGMQEPLLHRRATVHVSLETIRATTSSTPLIVWPSGGSAALVIPSLGVQKSWHDHVVPIASLTKMMTAYVVLKKLPLSIGQSGPCITISDSDVASYDALSAQDESSVLVQTGESLCERDLLNGVLVASASNYAVLLADMVSGSTTNFVTLMNQTARSLGLTGTTYADVSGFDPDSVSTALDQARLAMLLMRSPLVRAIVDQASVTLPVAGLVESFNPYVGTNGVIGVKSGRTSAAGGCDVLAMTFPLGGMARTIYAVVLGQEGGDLLGPAGSAALALAKSGLIGQLPHTHDFVTTKSFGALGWGGRRVSFGVATDTRVTWSHSLPTLRVDVRMKRLTGPIHRGETVGWLIVHTTKMRRLALVARGSVSPLSLWQRLI